MSLGPATLADRLEAAARQFTRHDSRFAEACAEAAAFFREEFDVDPGASGEDLRQPADDTVAPMGARRR